MKVLRLILSIVFLVLPACSEKLPSDMRKSLDVTIKYVEDYKASHSKLPDRNQFLAWLETNHLVGVVDFHVSTNNSNEYRVQIWRGERMLIYSSKSKTIREGR